MAVSPCFAVAVVIASGEMQLLWLQMTKRHRFCSAFSSTAYTFLLWKLWHSAYLKGTFCDTFHPEASGWRDCASCRKRIHCGCIMASSTYTILDFGGVKCAECAVNEALAPHRCTPSFWSPQAIQHAMDSAKRLSIDPEKAITVGMKSDSCVHVAGIKAGINPIASPDSVVCNVSPNKIATATIPGAAFQAQFPLSETGEESSVNSPHGTNNSCQKKVGKRRKNVYRKTRVQSRYSPQTSLEELKEICRVSKSSLVPLFSKTLTASDAEARNGRLVLPKRCAEAYFPDISAQQGIFVVVQDIKGDDWEFYYRYWLNTNGKMYVLEGLKDYIISEQWQPGDTVTVYKREEDGKLFMGLKKVQAGKSD
ncbi:HSI2-like 1 isoform 1 [Theobroma cacao]|uniref:HSI2-like 1 isoform 1 n=1 Tax=Theobroma cacao TaxID=3641 RepID=A0A061FE85_THECC|nr:HSI2-like 1 isoform 1 [Theobroma cacao]EOY12790.1 HSI2-like 1 isoform 1 [Theobroma cacao]EOY12791.1 HSI2-like 1 isoform 1 [Theobroma cacao]